jgi:hypothetical protein
MRSILTLAQNDIIKCSGFLFTSVRISIIKPKFDASPTVPGLWQQ